jgi:signal transduction histidine kinase/ligand-binding sensor domain-containing protein/DNA-binding response OmpR family regulator
MLKTSSWFNRLVLIVLALILLGSSNYTLAETNKGSLNNYPWVYHLNSEDGLPSNWVTSIVEDNFGLMWFGTWNGLAVWDGNQLKTFKKEDENAVLKSNMITDIKKASNGDIYICTAGSFVYVYDALKEELSQLEISNDTSLYDETAQKIYFNKNGIWIATNFGLIKYNSQTKNVQIFQNKKFIEQKKSQRIFAMIDGFDGLLWLGTENGVQYFDQKKDQFIEDYQLDMSRLNIDFQINCFYPDEFGRVWMGTNHGLFLYDKSNREFHPISDNVSGDNADFEINDIVGDKNGNLFIGTNSRLLRFNFKQACFYNLTHDVTQKHAINSYYIHSLHCSSSGVIWAGTYNSGVNYFKLSHKGLNHINSQQEGLCSSYVLDIVNDNIGNIWIGTENGLTRFSKDFKEAKSFLINKEPEFSSKNYVVRNVVVDYYNQVWLSLSSLGLVKLNTSNGNTEKVVDIKGGDNLKKNYVNSLFEIEPGLLCFDFGDKVKVYDTKSSKVANLIDYYNLTVDTFKNLQAIFKKHNQPKILVVTSHDIYLIDLTQNTTKNVSKNYKLGHVYSALIDSHDNIWLGSPNGLSLIPKDGTLKKIQFEGLSLTNSSILNILEDNQGNIWFTSANELVKIPSSQVGRTTIEFQNYITIDGLQNGGFKERANWVTPSGMIMLGGNDGLNYFYPEEISADKTPPRTLITELYINNKLQQPYLDGSILTQSIKTSQTVKVNHKQNHIKVSFASLDYIMSGKSKYAYMMEGLEKEWVYSGSQAEASYLLPPGKYTFKVKASNSWGVWNEEGISLNIEVSPPWWKSFWFYFAILVLILGILYSLHRIKTHQIKLRNKELEKKILEKTSDLLKLNADLKIINSEVVQQKERVESLAQKLTESNEQKIKLFTSISHEFRTPLTLIVGSIESLIEAGAFGGHKSQLQLIGKNANRLLTLIEQIIDLRKIDQKVMKLRIIDYKLQELLQDLIVLFSEKASKQGIKIVFNFSGHHPKTYIDKVKIENIIVNLISNAIKYTPSGGVISLSLEFERNAMKTFAKISVQDTGEGIPEKDLPFIFDRFYTVRKGGDGGIGIGLAFCKELIKMHLGNISCESKEGEGSKFLIELPVSANCYDEIYDNLDVKQFSTASLISIGFNEGDVVDNEIFAKLKINCIRNNTLPVLLIVEDHKDLKEMVISKLYDIGNIYEASNGLSGLQMAQAILPDLIISDILMPGLDGISLCEKIKSDVLTNHIPVVLLSAKTGEDEQLEGLSKGADDYLVKPFNTEILIQKVNNILKSREKLKDQYSSSKGISIAEIIESSSDQKYVKYITRIVEENMSDPQFSVENLSDILNLDRFQLYRKIHAVTGVSPSKFITRVRLAKALELLKSKKVNVTEVAYHLGFNSSSYFTRCFKEVYGVQPSKYNDLLSNRNIH